MKRIFALLLASVVLCLFSCENVPPTVVETSAPETEVVTEVSETEAPATKAPETEPPATEPPATEPPATEPPVTEPPVTEPPVTEPPVVEVPMPELTEFPADGTLIYYENFDGIATTYSGDSLIALLSARSINASSSTAIAII